MASHVITLTTTGNFLAASPTTASTNAGDTVTFKSAAQVYVKFKPGKWPFTETEATITVPAGTTGAGPYTVHAKSGNSINQDRYNAGTRLDRNGNIAGITTSAEIDID